MEEASSRTRHIDGLVEVIIEANTERLERESKQISAVHNDLWGGWKCFSSNGKNLIC